MAGEQKPWFGKVQVRVQVRVLPLHYNAQCNMIKIIFYFKMIYHCILGYFFITILRVKVTRFEDFLSFEMYNNSIFPYIRTNSRSKKEGRDGEGGGRGEGEEEGKGGGKWEEEEEEEKEKREGGRTVAGEGERANWSAYLQNKSVSVDFCFCFHANKNN